MENGFTFISEWETLDLCGLTVLPLWALVGV